MIKNRLHFINLNTSVLQDITANVGLYFWSSGNLLVLIGHEDYRKPLTLEFMYGCVNDCAFGRHNIFFCRVFKDLKIDNLVR